MALWGATLFYFIKLVLNRVFRLLLTLTYRFSVVKLYRGFLIDMTHIRIHIAKLLTFIVALQILNLSIFMQDFDPIDTHRNTIGEFNEINSIVEFVAEVVLDNTNALPEYHQQNMGHNMMLQHKHAPVKMVTFDDLQPARVFYTPSREYIHPLNEAYDFLYFREINPPPPKLA